MSRSLQHCFGYLSRFWRGLFSKTAKESETSSESAWCLVANIVDERPYGPEGKETRRGTKHFAAGAKIYCFPFQWGDGYERIRVIGRHRGSRRFVTMIIKSDWLTNWRAQRVYSPAVIKQLDNAWENAVKHSANSPQEEIANYVKMMEGRQRPHA